MGTIHEQADAIEARPIHGKYTNWQETEMAALRKQASQLKALIAESLDDIDDAIATTARAGNKGGLKVDGKVLSGSEISDRLYFLKEKRDRFAAALDSSPSVATEQTTEPDADNDDYDPDPFGPN